MLCDGFGKIFRCATTCRDECYIDIAEVIVMLKQFDRKLLPAKLVCTASTTL